MTISGPSIGTTGEDLELICGVRGSGNGVMERIIHNESYTSIFNPLLPSHGARAIGSYTCMPG